MSRLIRLLAAAFLVGMAAFCVFGFLAAPEAGTAAAAVQFLYGGVGIGCLGGGAGWLAWPRTSAGSAGRDG